jgi:hypothetical protein
MMTFILAAGYLFTVYLLLALAKRTGTKTVSPGVLSPREGKQQQEVSVTEVVNSQ